MHSLRLSLAQYNRPYALSIEQHVRAPVLKIVAVLGHIDLQLYRTKEFVKVNEKKQQRPSLRQKLKGLQKMIEQNKNRERSREKNKDRGQSL